MDDELSQAVVGFLGYGTASFPQHDQRALYRAFGPAKGATLEAKVRDLIAELKGIDVDWASNNDLADGARRARNQMHARHPELSFDALTALEWKFAFDWR